MATVPDIRIPVTVLTGFLGAGKTTLLNRVLTENHGLRIAVIENEFGEIGIDNELVVNAEEEIFEMNNGCICCTVRGDLIRILGQLLKRRDKFDYVLIETTGLADPGPVAQTFFSDDEMKERFRLDGIVTVVDAKHLLLHLDDAPEAKEQIAFADRILLNKIDLVSPSDADEIEARIRSVNRVAQIFRTTQSSLPVSQVIHLHAFDLDHKLTLDGDFLEPQLPFEWSGVFHLDSGEYQLVLEPGPDPVMGVVLLPLETHDADSHHHDGEETSEHEHSHSPEATHHEESHPEHSHSHHSHHSHGEGGEHEHDHGHAHHGPVHDALMSAEKEAAHVFQQLPVAIRSGGWLVPGKQVFKLILGEDTSTFRIQVPTHGRYALFTQHGLDEFSGRWMHNSHAIEPEHVHEHGGHTHDHQHDATVSSVGIEEVRELDPKRLNSWLSELLQTKGQDIFRMKGILHLKGTANRFVFQGVHMVFEGKMDRPWKADELRRSQLVFIGRNLDRDALNAGFRRCLA